MKIIDNTIKKVNDFRAKAMSKKLYKEGVKQEIEDIKEDKTPEKKEEKKLRRRNITILKDYLRKAGYEHMDEKDVSRIIKRMAIISCFVISLVVLILLLVAQGGFFRIIVYLFSTWTAVFGFLLVLIWVLLYLYLDVKIFQRTKQLEEVLPDFLQLTSANMSAGMPIDQAMWYAVRPRFGVLAKEIEEVAKSTIAGEDLEKALTEFARKYNSPILTRTVNLIIEGMSAGGELAGLLGKIVLDIQELKLMRREISASITTYVIFITFATVVAAPFLFALSTQLLTIIQKIMGSIDLSEMPSGSFSIGLSGASIAIGDFKIFAVLAVLVSSFFSASIVSVIKNGNVKQGLKYIPIFMIISLIIYFFANMLVGGLMGSFI
ncbi:MAG: type II secretion system F family protein [archaeon]